ncbi:MAG: glutathione ABC transporter permease GsiC, partial [Haloarculaceae archaeon]
MKLYQYVVRRLLFTIPKLWLASVVIFLMIHLAPGDPVSVLAPGRTTEAQRAAIAAKWGLNQPIYIQYFDWAANILHGDFGISFKTKKPVLQMIAWRLPISL